MVRTTNEHRLCYLTRRVAEFREGTRVVRCRCIGPCSRPPRCCTCFSDLRTTLFATALGQRLYSTTHAFAFPIPPSVLAVDCALVFSHQLWELAQDQPGGGGGAEEEETLIPASRAMEIIGMLMAAHQLPAGRYGGRCWWRQINHFVFAGAMICIYDSTLLWLVASSTVDNEQLGFFYPLSVILSPMYTTHV